MSPGKWDGKSRPSTNKYRKNYDDIFNSKKNKPKTQLKKEEKSGRSR